MGTFFGIIAVNTATKMLMRHAVVLLDELSSKCVLDMQKLLQKRQNVLHLKTSFKSEKALKWHCDTVWKDNVQYRKKTFIYQSIFNSHTVSKDLYTVAVCRAIVQIVKTEACFWIFINDYYYCFVNRYFRYFRSIVLKDATGYTVYMFCKALVRWTYMFVSWLLC